MTRTLRVLALVTIAFSLAAAIYAFSQLSYGFLGASLTIVLVQLLRTTGTALGLTLAIVALVANAQARRWRWFGVYLVLAIVTTYGPWFLTPFFFPWFASFFTLVPNGAIYLHWEVLSFSGPPVATALLVLVEEYGERIWEMSPGPVEDEADDLEVTPLQD
jgi:hypothetical protein